MDYKDIQKQYSEFIIQRTYSRWRDDLGRRETWDEAVGRYAEFMQRRVPEVLQEDFEAAIEAVRRKEVMPSMRLLWTAGTKAIEREEVMGFNCSFIAVSDLKVFHETMYLLMCGVGVGLSVERQFIAGLPEVSLTKYPEQAQTYTVEDSKEGWALTFKSLIRDWYQGIPSTWDVSKVRPKGSRIKEFGGRASGPGPLVELFNFTKNTIHYASGRKLNSKELADICCKIADIVIAGGVRRSALIIFSNLSDQRMKHYKEGQFWLENPQRALANISVAYTEKPEPVYLMDEWKQLMLSGSGERGLLNVEALPDPNMRGNPCQPANATLLSPRGLITMADVSVGDLIWSKEGWTKVVNKSSSGIRPVYEYHTTAGSFLGTKEHKVPTRKGTKEEIRNVTELNIIPGCVLKEHYVNFNQQLVMDGLVIGDGMVHKASNNLKLLCIGKKDKDYFSDGVAHLIGRHRPGISSYAYEVRTEIDFTELVPLPERKIPDRYMKLTYADTCSLLRGLFSANGSVISGGERITYKGVSFQLIRDIQTLLSSVGVRSYYTVNKPKEVKFNNGTYLCKQSYDLNITTDRDIFLTRIGFIQKYKMVAVIKDAKASTRDKYHSIIDVIHRSDEEVFNITVDNSSHTYWTNGINVANCAERMLKSRQCCNLSSVVVQPDLPLAEIGKRVKYATLLGTLQATLTKFNTKVLSKEWVKNTKEDAMLGVSMTGILSRGWEAYELNWLHDIAIDFNEEFAEILGINKAYGITAVKPEGSVSQVVGTSSGIHPEYAPYYIRRVRVSRYDPISKLLVDSGVPYHPEVGTTIANTDTLVFDFPMKGEAVRYRDNYVATEQLETYKLFKQEWCDSRGNPSCTVYVKEHEWLTVLNWVYTNWDLIGGVSFLPYDNGVYQLAPYEEITEAQFERMCENFPKIDFSKLSEYELQDNTTGAKQLSCMSGSCELV